MCTFTVSLIYLIRFVANITADTVRYDTVRAKIISVNEMPSVYSTSIQVKECKYIKHVTVEHKVGGNINHTVQ